MTDLTNNAAAALLRIVQPMIGGKKARVHPIVKRHRFAHVLQKLFHANREGSKGAIETDHGKLTMVLIVVSGRNLVELRLIEAERLFAEDMLAGLESCDDLRRMQMMARGNDDCVNRRTVENLELVGGAGAKSKFRCRMARM